MKRVFYGVIKEAFAGGEVPRHRYMALIEHTWLPRSARHRISDLDIVRLLQTCDSSPAGLRDALLIRLLCTAGLTVRDATALDWVHYDRYGSTLKVNSTWLVIDPLTAAKTEQWLESLGSADGPVLRALTRGGKVLSRRMSYSAVAWALRKRSGLAGIACISPADLNSLNLRRRFTGSAPSPIERTSWTQDAANTRAG